MQWTKTSIIILVVALISSASHADILSLGATRGGLNAMIAASISKVVSTHTDSQMRPQPMGGTQQYIPVVNAGEINFGLMSMISPPVAMAAFAASNLAGSKPMETALSAVRLGWTAFIIPFMFVLSPTLIMRGSVDQVLLAVVTAGLGVWIASAGFVGYFMRPLPFIPRIGFVVGGLALLLPAQAFPGAIIIEVCGAVVGVIFVGREFFTARRLTPK